MIVTHTHKKTQQSNRYGVMDIKWQNLENIIIVSAGMTEGKWAHSGL